MEKIFIDKDGSECVVTDETQNSFRIAIKAKTSKGIDTNDWHSDKEVRERFKVKESQTK